MNENSKIMKIFYESTHEDILLNLGYQEEVVKVLCLQSLTNESGLSNN